MKDFPGRRLGSGPEPRLPHDFASRVIEQAHITRTRKRRDEDSRQDRAAGFAALARDISVDAPDAGESADAGADFTDASSYGALSDFNALAWNNQSAPDPLTVLMPSAQPAEKFDAYYGAVSDDTYASWDPTSYDSSRTR